MRPDDCGPMFAVLLYGAVTVALAVFAFLGVPWTTQSLGVAVFLAAFPLLWLNERRAARMMQLIHKALGKVTFADGEGIEPENEGRLLFVVAPMMAAATDRLTLPQWGIEAPAASAGVCARVEVYRRPNAWVCGQPPWRSGGQWCEGGTEVASARLLTSQFRVGAFAVPGALVEQLDIWEPFSPPPSERLTEIVRGVGASSLSGIGRMLGLAAPPPFPGERPRVLEDGSRLYYQFGGGRPRHPSLGDVRVSFLHIPCSERSLFTVVGVQRGMLLEPFRYREAPPQGLGLGRADSEDFNIGAHGSEDGDASLKSAHVASCTDDEGRTLLHQRTGKSSDDDLEGQPSWRVPRQLTIVVGALSVALAGWRHILHRAAPEHLLCIAAGSHNRCSYFIRAHYSEFLFTWRLRVCGFMIMVAGVEVALWRWEAALVFLGPIELALWAIALLGAGGFTAATVAAALAFYRPAAAALYLAVALSLFAALFGVVPLLAALGIVAFCMLCLAALLAIHLALPC